MTGGGQREQDRLAVDAAVHDTVPSGAATVRLSVVIPHYNHIDFLPRALASVIAQELASIEILVVDDGSAQACQPELDRLASMHTGIRILRHAENRGAPAALNTGLAAARGTMITFLGADDLALSGLYETMVGALERNPEIPLACGDIAIIGDDGHMRGIRPMTPPSFSARTLSASDVRQCARSCDNWICNTATVCRTDMLRAIGGFQEQLGAFCDGFAVRRLAFAAGFIYVPGIRGVWRVAEDTLSAGTALDEKISLVQLERLDAAVQGSSIARDAPEYPAVFARRARFSAARLNFVWRGALATPGEISRIAGLTPLDECVLASIRSIIGYGRGGRLLALAWLAVRLWPLSPARLALSALRNRAMLRKKNGTVLDQLNQTEKLAERLTRGREAA